MLGPVKEMARLVGRLAAEETQLAVDTPPVPGIGKRRSAATKLKQLIEATFVLFPADERSSYGNFEFVPDQPSARADLMSAYLESSREERQSLVLRVAEHVLGGHDLTIMCESSSSPVIYEVDWSMVRNSSGNVGLISIEYAQYGVPGLCIKVCTSCASDRKAEQPLRYKDMFQHVFKRMVGLSRDEWYCTPSRVCFRVLQFCRFLDGVEGRSVMLFDRYFAFEKINALKKQFGPGESIVDDMVAHLKSFYDRFNPVHDDEAKLRRLHVEALERQRFASHRGSDLCWLKDTHQIVGQPSFYNAVTAKQETVGVCLCEFTSRSLGSVLVISVQRSTQPVPKAVVTAADALVKDVVPAETDIEYIFSKRSPGLVFIDKQHFVDFLGRERSVDGCVFGCSQTAEFVRRYRGFSRDDRIKFAQTIITIRTAPGPIMNALRGRETGMVNTPLPYEFKDDMSSVRSDERLGLSDRFVFGSSNGCILVVIVRLDAEDFQVKTIAYDGGFRSAQYAEIRDELLRGIRLVDAFCSSFRHAVEVLCRLLDGERGCYDFNLNNSRAGVCGLINNCINRRYGKIWAFHGRVHTDNFGLTSRMCSAPDTMIDSLVQLHTVQGAFELQLKLSGWGDRLPSFNGSPARFGGSADGYGLYLALTNESKLLCLYQRVIRSDVRFHDELRRISVVPVPDDLLGSITFDV